MVTVLRLLAMLLLGLCLVAGISWLVADHFAARWVDSALRDLHLDKIISVGGAHLPTPDVVRLTDVALYDEVSGVQVARVDRVDLSVALPGPGGWTSLRPELLSGQDGTVLLTADGETLVLARAIDSLLQHIFEAMAAAPSPESPHEPEPPTPAGAAAGSAPFLPPMVFTNIELTLRLEGQPDGTMPGCVAFLKQTADRFLVDVDAGRDGGHVSLEFDDNGLRRVLTRDLPVTPVCALFLPSEREIVVDDVRPEGRLDLDLNFDADWNATASGVLREGTLRPPRSPLPLTDVTLPFEFDRENFRVREALASFEGGSLTASVDHGAQALRWSVDVVNAVFHRDYLDLLPDQVDIEWIEPADGGNVELHLRMVEPVSEPGAAPVRSQLSGWGGFLVNSLSIGPTHVLVEDMVGLFELRDDVLTVQRASGRCASGVVSLRGTVNVVTGDMDAGATVYDVDIAQIRHALDPQAGAGAPDGAPKMSGWLQGDLRVTGRINDPSLSKGSGHFSIRGGNLWTVPVLDAVLDTLRLVDPGANERHRLTVRFDVRGLRFDIQLLKLESPFLSLVGDGYVGRDGTLDINIVPIKVPLGYVGDLIEYIQAQVVQLQIRGTADKPEVKVVPVKFVTENVSSFWGWLGGKFSSEPEPARPPFPDEEPAPDGSIPELPVPFTPEEEAPPAAPPPGSP